MHPPDVDVSTDHPRSPPKGKTGHRRAAWITAVILLVIFVGFALFSGTVVGRSVDAIRAAASGADGPGSLALVYGLAAVFTFLTVLLPLPAEASAFLNGALFPSFIAFLLTWTMAMLGATASYEIGRWCGRPPAERLFGGDRLSRFERLIERAGWPTLLALRLSPVMAFTAINWASGILALSRPVFYWTTAVGLIPGTFVFTVVPEVLEQGRSTGLLITLAFAVVIGLLAMSYLRFKRTKPI